MTDDSAFRVMAVNTTQTVTDALERQTPSGITRKAFGDLITGAVLVRETMAPNQRVQAILKRRQHTGSLVADTHPTDGTDRKSTRLNSSHLGISYAVFCF